MCLHRVRHHAEDERHGGDLPVIAGVKQLEVFSVTQQTFLQHPVVVIALVLYQNLLLYSLEEIEYL